MTSPLNALLERSGNPAIGAYESLDLCEIQVTNFILHFNDKFNKVFHFIGESKIAIFSPNVCLKNYVFTILKSDFFENKNTFLKF